MKNKLNKKGLIASLSVVALAAFFVPLLASCSGDIPELQPTEIINTLFPNLWVFIAQVGAMLVVFSIILWLVWKPTNKMLDKRREFMANEIKEAEETRKEALVYLESAKQQKLDAQTEAVKIVTDAKAETMSYRENLEREAREAADKIVATARANAENERLNMLNVMKQEAKEAAYVAAEALMKKELSRADNDKLVDEFIKDLEESSK
ncbi:ATP F0F1 synthase subunit B [Ureaplasma miroungigenitalium]|uniref:ATP synthase subunit b n=1 Tax=Ureaplasma miroungigenitalium TaxID=1042321 RepID=A0ABT3BN00_9BACT|nr:ATP F0F1 synthase subunit B [Ureaplasma miroungigenitalium]MCV3728618.1 ATP F0F1 synthase subunit B [Ureaplasma miroungigenitalium]MCV3734310.1 ATP F0F1 synthase subunit B [Ureaplasma miroungigenitalium]